MEAFRELPGQGKHNANALRCILQSIKSVNVQQWKGQIDEQGKARQVSTEMAEIIGGQAGQRSKVQVAYNWRSELVILPSK